MPVVRERDQPGVVYTPPEVASAMVRVALEPLIRGRTARELCALRVCDFAVGEGAFVVEVVRVLAEAMTAAGVSRAREQAGRCVVGVDIDARAVATARLALGDLDLRVADALAVDWAAAFPDVFARGGFDAVVGNPPYIRQEWLGAGKLRAGFATAGGVADLYVYFVELAHRIARPGGRYCVITPNKWLTAAYGRELRGFLAEAGSVEGVIDLGRAAVFAEADAFPCVTWGTVGEPVRTPIRAARIATGTISEALAAGIPHPRERWTAEPWYIDAPADRALIDRLERTWPALGDVLPDKPARGVVTGCNRAFVIDRATRERLLADNPSSAALIRPLLKGRDVRRFRAAASERWILLVDRGTSLDDHPAITAHLAGFRAALAPRPADHLGPWSGRKPGTYRWCELQDPVGALAASRAPRLFYQDIQSGPACALDRSGDLVPDTTVWILPSADPVLLALLNSSLYGWYAQRRFPPALGGSVRPKREYMRALPVAAPDPALRARITGLVEEALAATTPALDAALDAAIFSAYALSPRERALVIGQPPLTIIE
ncbi:MAG: Eco57I restriction-modification methylase domain-containing protein [Kofleriaceae bacterium]